MFQLLNSKVDDTPRQRSTGGEPWWNGDVILVEGRAAKMPVGKFYPDPDPGFYRNHSFGKQIQGVI